MLPHFRFQTSKIVVKASVFVVFVTSVCRKPTFSGVYTNYESFIPTYQKRGLLRTLLHRSFSICGDFKTFYFEIDDLKTILIKKQLPLEFHRFVYQIMVPNVPKTRFLLRYYSSWEILHFKFERSFKIYLVIN